MSDPKHGPQLLIQAARRARPDDETRRRIRAGLDGRIALIAAAGVGASTAAGAATAAATEAAVVGTSVVGAGLFGGVAKIGLAVGLLVVTGAGVRAWLADDPAPSPPAVVVISSGEAPATVALPAAPEPVAALAEEVAASAEEVVASATVASAQPAPTGPASGSWPARRDAASIAAEVALLRKAQASLREGDSAASLKAIDALAAKHPDGALREEREAARVVALCAAGRVDDARVEALRFLSRWKGSLQASRVRASCAFTKGASPQKP